MVCHLIAPSPFVKMNSNFLDVEMFEIVSGCNARTFSMRSGGNVTLIRSRFFDMLEMSLLSDSEGLKAYRRRWDLLRSL